MELIELMQKCCLCWAFGHLREDYLAKVYILTSRYLLQVDNILCILFHYLVKHSYHIYV